MEINSKSFDNLSGIVKNIRDFIEDNKTLSAVETKSGLHIGSTLDLSRSDCRYYSDKYSKTYKNTYGGDDINLRHVVVCNNGNCRFYRTYWVAGKRVNATGLKKYLKEISAVLYQLHATRGINDE